MRTAPCRFALTSLQRYGNLFEEGCINVASMYFGCHDVARTWQLRTSNVAKNVLATLWQRYGNLFEEGCINVASMYFGCHDVARTWQLRTSLPSSYY